MCEAYTAHTCHPLADNVPAQSTAAQASRVRRVGLTFGLRVDGAPSNKCL